MSKVLRPVNLGIPRKKKKLIRFLCPSPGIQPRTTMRWQTAGRAMALASRQNCIRMHVCPVCEAAAFCRAARCASPSSIHPVSTVGSYTLRDAVTECDAARGWWAGFSQNMTRWKVSGFFSNHGTVFFRSQQWIGFILKCVERCLIRFKQCCYTSWHKKNNYYKL